MPHDHINVFSELFDHLCSVDIVEGSVLLEFVYFSGETPVEQFIVEYEHVFFGHEEPEGDNKNRGEDVLDIEDMAACV